MEPFLCGMTYSFILGLNIHQFNTDAGAASSSKCVNLPNHFLSQFVLKNAINPSSIVPNQIFASTMEKQTYSNILSSD